MGRREDLAVFMAKHDNVSYNKANVSLVLANLKKADEAGCLRQFFLNEKPYQSAFTFFVFNDQQKAVRGKDQIAIVLALNLYGAEHPGFAAEVNTLLKGLVGGSTKEAQSVIVLIRAQMELQQLEISLINFVDRELLLKTNDAIHRLKGPNIALALACLFGGAIGMPGFSMIGLFPLTFVAIGVFVYSFMKLPYWLAVNVISEDDINASVRPVGECLV